MCSVLDKYIVEIEILPFIPKKKRFPPTVHVGEIVNTVLYRLKMVTMRPVARKGILFKGITQLAIGPPLLLEVLALGDIEGLLGITAGQTQGALSGLSSVDLTAGGRVQ